MKIIIDADACPVYKSALKIAKENNISMPITDEIYAVLYEGKEPMQSAKDLMIRDLKAEI